MLAHYLTVAWRSFLAQRVHALVNVLGLTVGFTCFIGAYVFVHYVENADRHFANADRIYVVFTKSYFQALALDLPAQAQSSPRVEEYLRIDLPEAEAIARLTRVREIAVSTGGATSFRRVRHTQPSFLDIFDLNFLHGSGESADDKVRSAILTEQAAEAMFGTADAIGQSIELPDEGSVEIAGVISAIPEPSHLGTGIFAEPFEVLIVSAIPEDTGGPNATYWGAATEWLDPTIYTYVLLPADGRLTLADLNDYLAGLGARVVDESAGRIELDARPVSRIAVADFSGFLGDEYPFSVPDLILLLGVMVLAIAGVNFVNLATASVTVRTREVAVRKVIGASTGHVVMQHLLEALLTAALALSFALLFIELIIPVVNTATQKTFSIPWSLQFGWFLVGVVLLCGSLVGAYPAYLLARIRPTQALRITGWGAGSRAFRTILISAQFATASFLAILVVVIQMQNEVLQEAGLGFTGDPYVVLTDTPRDVGIGGDALFSALLRSPDIQEVAGANYLPWDMMISGTAYSRSPDPAVESIFTQQRGVSFNYFDALGMALLAGSGFTSRQQAGINPASSPEERLAAVILDRAAAEQFGWPNPSDAVGQLIYSPADPDSGVRLPLEVIGVVESPPLDVIGWGYDAFAYELSPQSDLYTIIRIDGNGVGRALEHIDAVWSEMAPHSPIRREFVDARFRQLYTLFDITGRTFVALASLGFLVAAMGLFGMAAFMTGRRRQEVGIRKTLGASEKQVVMLFLGDFYKPILVASIIAWPFGFLASSFYLSTFVQRAALTPEPFLASLALSILVALIAVAGQIVAAAATRPAQVLRCE